jgi:aminoglycoside phosphotransferase (APT) family kinase protein
MKGRQLATGNVTDVFEWDCRVLKLYKVPEAKPLAFREAAIHAAVEALRLPVPMVRGVRQVGSRWGIVFDRVSERSFADRMRGSPDQIPHYLDHMAQLQVAIHRHVAIAFANLKVRLKTRIEDAPRLDDRQREALLEELAVMPDGDRLCHGDLHPLNILGDADKPKIIDWPDACRGDPAADVCRSYLLLTLHARELAAPYLDAYCRLGGISRQAILDWLPYVTAAKLAEKVPGETHGLCKILGLSE